jgi:cyanate permease
VFFSMFSLFENLGLFGFMFLPSSLLSTEIMVASFNENNGADLAVIFLLCRAATPKLGKQLMDV